MTYIEGFVAAVPAENKEAYIRHAADAAPLFKEFGVTRMVENWGDDVPDGKVTDFKQAVQAKEGEVVVFSWFEYRNRQVRDAAIEKMMSDPRMKEMGAAMPFDAKRMIVGGFEYGGWVNYDPDFRLDFRWPSWWWVVDDRYTVAFAPVEGYRVLRRFPYQGWFGLIENDIVALERAVDAGSRPFRRGANPRAPESVLLPKSSPGSSR
jgi:uncharacterized protein YbaA (DUF1428 family)